MPGETKNESIYLVDGTAQLFRAYFAMPGLTNDDGLPVGAVLGFANMMRRLIREDRPPYIGVAFDLGGGVFRHEQYAAYKANRPPTPEDLDVQMPYAKQVCEVLGVPVLERQGFEADDLIATYTRMAREEGLEVVVVASDKDLLQLVGEGVTLYNPSKEVRLDSDGVIASFGVAPERVRDVLGLMGDSVDNIPGVPGVGQKTALAAVSTYGDTEAVIERGRRFVATYDARDELLAAIADASAATELTPDRVSAIASAGASFREALSALLEIERDEEAAKRLRPVLELDFAGAELQENLGQPGRKAVRPLAPLKKELKAMDRGSSKRIWYAIVEFADQARLSRDLATLHYNAPAEIALRQMRLDPPESKLARTFFESMGFRSLTAEYAQEEAEAAAGSATSDGSVETTPGSEVAATSSGLPARYEMILTEAQLERLIEDCLRAGYIAVDTETDSTDAMRARLVGISLAHTAGSAAYIPIGHDYLGAPQQLDLATVQRMLGPMLGDPAVAKSGQNYKYDAHVLRRHGMPVEGWKLDTMVAAFLLNSSRTSFGMDSLAAEFLGHKTIKYKDLVGSGAKQKTLNEIDVERVTEYAAEDAEVTFRLAAILEERLRESNLIELYEKIDGPLLPILVEMEAWGIRIDTQILAQMSAQMSTRLDAARVEIHELAGGEFNIDSPKQLREVLFERLKLKPRRKTAKSKAASTDAQTLEELVAEHPIASRLLEYRELSKLKSTYVDSLPRLVHPETGRVHTSYHPTGAATGRLSSSDPNLQNIPARSEDGRRIRAAFVPQDGWVFLASDYSQVELRVLAHMAEDPGLIAAFREGQDIHRHTASRIFEVLPDLVTDPMRRRAKAINFGILYGMSETRLAREQGISRADARKFIQAYFTRFSKVRGYIDAVRDQAHRDAAVRTLFGRVRLFPQLHQRLNRAHQEAALRGAVNTTIQGTAADLMKMAMLRVHAVLEGSGHEARILLQVHDELLIEVREQSAGIVAGLVREAMEQVHPLEVPLSVDQKVGKSWLEVT